MASDNSGGMTAHNQTYSGFLSMLKWGTVATVIVAVTVILLIAN